MAHDVVVPPDMVNNHARGGNIDARKQGVGKLRKTGGGTAKQNLWWGFERAKVCFNKCYGVAT